MSEPRFAALAAAIEDELALLAELGAEMAELRPRLGDRASSFDRRAAGSIVHDLYTGAERVFERIASELDGGSPAGSEWHVALLRQMALELPGQRPAVIVATTAEMLDAFLRFRHVFRNVYGRQLQWGRMRDVVAGLDDALAALTADLRRFTAWLRKLARDT